MCEEVRDKNCRRMRRCMRGQRKGVESVKMCTKGYTRIFPRCVDRI